LRVIIWFGATFNGNHENAVIWIAQQAKHSCAPLFDGGLINCRLRETGVQ